MKRIKLIDKELARSFFSQFDQNIRQLEDEFGVMVAGRGSELVIKGARKKVLATMSAIEDRLKQIKSKHDFRSSAVVQPPIEKSEKKDVIFIGSKRQVILARPGGQKAYVQAVRDNDVVVGIGPAGTGKTYLAISLAIEHLKQNKVERIVISRPAIEAGEKLGFLPGDLEEKVRPYLQPVYDALYDLIWPEEIRRLMEHRIIEILPLAYMRGRTLSDAFIVLDEAQNATPEQMKMFLTRLGMGSRAIITGDITQSDLPAERTSGLEDIEGFLKKVKGIKFAYLTEEDVVRHPLVREIILAYEKEKQKKRSAGVLRAQPPTQSKNRRKKSPPEDKSGA
ncbi:MAG: PhoH family protein [Candidatus Omnitrophota bacterium]